MPGKIPEDERATKKSLCFLLATSWSVRHAIHQVGRRAGSAISNSPGAFGTAGLFIRNSGPDIQVQYGTYVRSLIVHFSALSETVSLSSPPSSSDEMKKRKTITTLVTVVWWGKRIVKFKLEFVSTTALARIRRLFSSYTERVGNALEKRTQNQVLAE